MARRLLAHYAPFGLGLRWGERASPAFVQATLCWPHCVHEAVDCTNSGGVPSRERSWRNQGPASPWALARWRRAFQTAGAGGGHPPDENVADLQAFMEGLAATKLRQELAVQAIDRPFMEHKELVQFILKSGAAPTDAAAEELAGALVRGGVVLRLGGTVYLKPAEVAEMVFGMLPSDPSVVRQRLVEVEAELQDLERKRQHMMAAAHRWPRFWLNVGCVAAVGQVFLMAYLTWWELSWDVMEPVAYHLTLTWGAFAYIYFLVMRGRTQLDYPDFKEYWCNVQEAKKREESGFDHSKYLHLSKVRENHERYLRAAAVAAQPAVPASQGQAVPGNTSQEPHAHEPGAKGKVE